MIASVGSCLLYCKGYVALSYMASASSMLEDTNISLLQFGIMTGPSQLAVLSVCSLLHGYIVDRIQCFKLYFCINGVLLGLACLWYSFASGFLGMIVPTMIVSCTFSSFVPVSLKYIGKYFHLGERGLPISIFQTRVFIGSSMAASSMLVSSAIGWRSTFLIIGGLFAVLISLFMTCIRDERIEHSEGLLHGQPSIKAALQHILDNPTMIVLNCIYMARAFGGFARGYFESLYIVHTYPEYTELYSLVTVLTFLCCPFALILSNRVSDYMESRGDMKFRLYLCG